MKDVRCTIKVKHEGFIAWVKMGLEFAGSGTYGRPDESTFVVNVSFHHVSLLQDMLKAWAKGYVTEFKKRNRGARLAPKSLYELSFE